MSFSADWLALREPADHAARDPALLRAAAAAAGPAPLVVDLGCGAGSNLRALRPHLPVETRWRLVDHDPGLLALAAESAPGAEALALDLATAPADTLAQALDGADLVTAAALFDLVSEDWLAAFVAALPPGAAVYAALSYDGAEDWSPPHPDDHAAHQAFLAHQRTDKGFGPALGPTAAERLAEMLRARGYAVTTAPSPWRLTAPAQGPLIGALADGVAEAAAAMGADPAPWRAQPRTAVTIGHLDLLATP